VGVVGLVAIVAVVALALLPAATQSRTLNGETSSVRGLVAYDVATSLGPLPPCSGADCTAANTVHNLIHVVNLKQLRNWAPGFTTRATLQNAFVVTSVDEEVFVNGAQVPDFPPSTLTPPPNTNVPAWSGRWPSTVTCQGQPPCNVVGDPAVIPGENTVVVFDGWSHGVGEPNGTYVFKFTVHGTLNGTPVDLTASSPPISMTG
jgi:hypothetical protein